MFFTVFPHVKDLQPLSGILQRANGFFMELTELPTEKGCLMHVGAQSESGYLS